MDENADWDAVLSEDVNCRQYHGETVKGYVTDIITDKSIEWLENRDKEKPFLLLCHHKAPHDEFEYHPRYEHLLDDVEIPLPESMFEDKKPPLRGIQRVWNYHLRSQSEKKYGEDDDENRLSHRCS